MKTGPRLPGQDEIPIPEIAKGDEYLVPPDKKLKTPGVLKFSPMRALADTLPSSSNPLFAKNIVNRLWWMMMGRGLVDPLDLHHSDNPPSHPELFELLAKEMRDHQFDLKWMMRELANSQTYQRSGLFPSDVTDTTAVSEYRFAIERPLSPTQLLASLRLALGETSTDAKTLSEMRDRFDKAFANPPKEPEVSVAPTVKAALFLSNDSVIMSWLTPRDGNTVDRLTKLEDNKLICEESYLHVLSRLPSEEEHAQIERFLQKFDGPRERAISHVVWALATSTEFFVNH